MTARALGCALAVLLWMLASSARAQGEDPKAPAPDAAPPKKELDIMAMPLLGDASLPMGGWSELLIRIQNRGSETRGGTVNVHGGLSRWSDENASRTDAPFSVSAGATVSLRVPVRVGWSDDPVVQVIAQDGEKIYEQSFPRTGDGRTLLVDVARASALGSFLRGVPVGSRNEPWAVGYMGYPSSSSSSIVEVSSPLYDPVTGDPLLPQRAAGYARVAAVLMRSDELARLGAAELEALSGYLLAGGTLAVVLSRPEDARHPVMTALVGGEARPGQVHLETLKELVLAPPGGGGYWGGKGQPRQTSPEPEVADALRGFSGGNLKPSPYGGSAVYGLGEVHLLAFDPQSRPAVDSPWVHVRMTDLLRRANERTASALFRHGGPHTAASEIRRQLDPNEGARWAIVVTALLLCAYSVVAGPINFGYWRSKHRPLRALFYLPIVSGLTFGAVVGIGIVAKGCSGRARHLTVAEAGAGMKRATARRWRGLFVPTQQKMAVHAVNASGVLGTELMNHGDEARDRLVVDRDGLRLVDLTLLPWETMLVREDGYVDLGEGIAMVKQGAETLVINRTDKRLRGLLLVDPNAGGLFLESLDSGASAASGSFASLPGFVRTGSTPGGLPLRDLDVYAANAELEAAAPGLTDAWLAVLSTLTLQKDWFPDGVPVLLAQLEGGEGNSVDAGLRLDSDRVLVRVVGYGGAGP